MSPSVAVLGAGVLGLVAAHELSKEGWQVDVLERWPGLGGQAATFDVGADVLLERYYHHWFTSDTYIVDLCRELGVEVEWRPSSVAFFAGAATHPFDSPADLLRFSPLSIRARLRMGLAVANLKLRHKEVGPFEQMTAYDWIVSNMGREAWERVWGPMMEGKFGSRARDVSMSWLWARLAMRRQVKGSEARGEVLGYPKESFEPLFRRLREEIESRGGRVLIDTPAARLARAPEGFTVTLAARDAFRTGHDPREYPTNGEGSYDAVLATVPNWIFEAMLEPSLAAELSPGYQDRLRSIEYHAALCLVLELDRPFSEYYWTNVADRSVPFIGLIEHTNFVEPERYGGRRFLYVANYNEHGDPLLEQDADELLASYEPALRAINPSFDRSWVREKWLFREPDAQPIVTPGYPSKMPPLETGVPNLLLANTTQVYPEDRGTNYAVRLGREAAARLAGGQRPDVVSQKGAQGASPR